MNLTELLNIPIDKFWNNNIKNLYDDNKLKTDKIDIICNLTLVTPINEITYKTKHSNEYSKFKETVSIDNNISYNNMKDFIYNIKEYSEDNIFNLSQFLYYELYYNSTFGNPGRFLVDDWGNPNRTLSENDIKKIILLEDSILNNYRLKDKDKMCVHDILGMSYCLGEWGNLESSELIFNLINISMDYLEHHIVNKKTNDIYIPIKTTHSPGQFYDNNEFNMFQYHRYRVSVTRGLGKLYQLKGNYQESIDMYKKGLGLMDNILSYNRNLESLTEMYKSSDLMGDNKQCLDIHKTIKETFIGNYNNQLWTNWLNDNIIKQYEVAREIPMTSLMIRDKIYKNLE